MRAYESASSNDACSVIMRRYCINFGGIENLGAATLERVVVTGNSVDAEGASGLVTGGGITNSTLFGSTPSLSITDGVIAGNELRSSSGVTRQGGGLFTSFPVMLTRTVIAGNRPDQCSGC